MWRDGSLLVVKKGEAFPDRCVKNNRPAHGRRVQQVAEQGYAGLFLVNLWSPIAAALIGNVVAKRVPLAVGLSNEWSRKRRRAFWVAGAIIIVSITAAAYGVIVMGRGAMGLWLLPLGILATLGGLVYGLNASTLVTAKRITNDYIWLGGVHSDFLADLPEWPSELWADLREFPDTNK